MISKNRKKLIRSLERKKARRESQLFVAEGVKLMRELVGRFDCVYVAATEQWLDDNAAVVAGMRAASGDFACDVVTDDELRQVSFQETPQQVLALFRQPQDDRCDGSVAAKELCLALDDVQNPGNLGTIVRLADWFGIRHIFCSHGCADIYNPKTVQATMGGMAHVQLHYCDLAEMIGRLPEGTAVYGTFLDGRSIYETELEQTGLIVMGNEGRGVSDAVADKVTHRLLIPNYPPGCETTESLNVGIATAIVCAEFRRIHNS